MKKILLIIIMLWGVAYSQCPPPTGVTATPVTPQSETVRWVSAAFSSYYFWTLELTAGGPVSTGITTDTSLTFSGLIPATSYYFTVRNTCTFSASSVVPINFTTSSVVVYTPMTAAGYQFKYLKADSGFALPYKSASIGRGTDRPGSLVYSPGNGALVWNGSAWVSLGASVALVDTNHFAAFQ